MDDARDRLAREVAETRRRLAVLAANTGSRKYLTKRLNFKRARHLQEIAKRDSFYADLLRYLLMLVLLVACVLSLQTVEASEVTQSFDNIFFQRNFPMPPQKLAMNFYGTGAGDEWWAWARGPLLGGLYGPTFPAQGRLIGAPRLRQARVRAAPCGARLMVELYGGTSCYPTFTAATASGDPFGSNPLTGGGPFVFTDNGGSELLSSDVYNPDVLNHVQSYGGGGFIVLLPVGSNESLALEVMTALQAGGYFDSATRAIAIEFTIYLPSVDLFVVTQARTRARVQTSARAHNKHTHANTHNTHTGTRACTHARTHAGARGNVPHTLDGAHGPHHARATTLNGLRGRVHV
jgi:hypothetical protein